MILLRKATFDAMCDRLTPERASVARQNAQIRPDGRLEIEPRLISSRASRAPVSQRPTPTEPTVRDLAENFVQAMETWRSAGFPVVTAEQYAERSAICEPCDFWDGTARLGLGKCKAPECGCTKFKRWLKTERCKHPAGSRWPELT